MARLYSNILKNSSDSTFIKKNFSGKTTELLEKIITRLFISIFIFIIISIKPGVYASEKTIIVGGNGNYPPYEFIDEEGEPNGYNVELTRAIADVMGMKVEFDLGDWSVVRHALEEGEIDVLQGMSYSEGRTKVVDFSIPHTIVNHSIYARNGVPPIASLEELAGKEVAFHALGFTHNYLSEKKIPVIPVLTGSPAGAIKLIADGNPDYAVVASLPAAYLINQMNIKNVSATANSVISVKYCYAVKKGNTDLLARFNEGLAILKQTGRHQIIYDKWLGVLEPKGAPWKNIIKYGSIILTVFLLALTGSLLWSWTLRKQVALRTADLQQEVRERKRTMNELKLKQRQLIQADKMASLGILVSGVAHEINNPNGLILLNMPLILDYFNDIRPIIDNYYSNHGDFPVAGLSYSRLQTKIGPKLADIQDSAKRIKRIVDDLKDFARRDESEIEQVIDINEVASAAVRLLENRIQKSTNFFKTDFGTELVYFKGNPQRIEQVIVNLLLNAFQALRNSDEGVYLLTKYSKEKDEIILEIHDEGEGILPKNIPYLTDPFFTTKRQTGGTGLGLSVSAGIIKDHHGSMEFTSIPEHGTTVTISFPACGGIKA